MKKKLSPLEDRKLEEAEAVKAYRGKHIGSCAYCGFSLLTDQDEFCPRCEKEIKLEEK